MTEHDINQSIKKIDGLIKHHESEIKTHNFHIRKLQRDREEFKKTKRQLRKVSKIKGK